MGYYDDLTETHGDNDSCKRMYKRGKVFLAMLIGILFSISQGMDIVDNWETHRFQALYQGAFLMIGLYLLVRICEKVIRQPLDSIHVKPDLEGMDWRGGKLKYFDDNGEYVFLVKYKKHTIKGEYRNSRYFISVIPKERLFKKEQTVLQEYPAATEQELPLVLAQAAEFVAELSGEATIQN